ncbi:MAG TPA: hypothetical protein V6D47_13140 [Oscillatoriaceae cyanobacterium]
MSVQPSHPIRHRVGSFVVKHAPKNPVGDVDNMVGTQAAPLGGVKHVVGGVVSGVAQGAALQALLDSQSYRKGQWTAPEYAGHVASDALGWGVWGLGSALTGAGLLAFGAPGLVAGAAAFCIGTLAATVWSRTGGNWLVKTLSKVLPNRIVQPAADWFCKHLADPIFDHVITPIENLVMKHKLIAGAIGGVLLVGVGALLATRFPATGKKLGLGALEIGCKLAAGSVAASEFTHYVLNKLLPDHPFKAKTATA